MFENKIIIQKLLTIPAKTKAALRGLKQAHDICMALPHILWIRNHCDDENHYTIIGPILDDRLKEKILKP